MLCTTASGDGAFVGEWAALDGVVTTISLGVDVDIGDGTD